MLRHSVVEGVVECRVLIAAVNELIAVAGNELDRRGRETDLEAVEIPKQGRVIVVNAAVRFVGDDDVEETGIEVGKEAVESRIGGEVDVGVPVVMRSGIENGESGISRRSRR